MGHRPVHNEQTLAASLAQAQVHWPETIQEKHPLVIFMHGSSGLRNSAVGNFQEFLAKAGFVSVAPDSFALPGRPTYNSQNTQGGQTDLYEYVHGLRQQELKYALARVKEWSGIDPERIFIAGSSEGAVAVCRYQASGIKIRGRVVLSYGAENCYFTSQPNNRWSKDEPVLQIVAQLDPFFTKRCDYLGNNDAQGHAVAELQAQKIPGQVCVVDTDVHNLLNHAGAMQQVLAFLQQPPSHPPSGVTTLPAQA